MSQKRSKVIAVVLAPPGEVGFQLLREARRWFGAGLIEDFLWVQPDELLDGTGNFLEVPCNFVGDSDEVERFDLLQYLGTIQVGHLDLFVPWFLADAAPDERFARLGIRLRKTIERLMPKPDFTSQKKLKQLYSTLLSIPSSRVTAESLAGVGLNYRQYDINLLVSPESRSEPWTPSAPVLEGEDFVLFALAQIVSIAGVWSGKPESISILLKRRGFVFSEGNVVLSRSIASLVVAQGVASRMIRESLSRVGDSSLNPYKLSNQQDLRRPESISDLDDELIRDKINSIVNHVVEGSDGSFVYDGPKKPRDTDYTRLPMEAWIFFLKFTRDALFAMPYYSAVWVINKLGDFTNTLLKNVRQPIPEKYMGLDKELQDRLKEVTDFRADRNKQDALAISATAFQQMPQVWEKLRLLAFGALDGSGESTKTNKPKVFPSPDYVAADPDARFVVSSKHRQILELENFELSVADVDVVRQRLNAEIERSNESLDELRRLLAEIDHPVVSTEDFELEAETTGHEGKSETPVNSDDPANADSVAPEKPPAKVNKPPKQIQPTAPGFPTFVNDPSIDSVDGQVVPQEPPVEKGIDDTTTAQGSTDAANGAVIAESEHPPTDGEDSLDESSAETSEHTDGVPSAAYPAPEEEAVDVNPHPASEDILSLLQFSNESIPSAVGKTEEKTEPAAQQTQEESGRRKFFFQRKDKEVRN